jgi:C-terminal peptidase prc
MNKRFILFIFLLCSITFTVIAQDLKAERILHQNILKTIKNDIKENYYDPKMHGIDIEENFKKASDLIDKATSSPEMSDIVSRVLLLFDDSHLYFMPPRKTVTVDYGWELTMVDGKAFITEIKEDSDAFKKGIRVGDQIYMIEGFIPTRQDFSFLKFHFEVLSPQSSLEIFLIKPSGNKYKLKINAKITNESVFIPESRDLDLEYEKNYEERTNPSYYKEIPGLSILKMPSFSVSAIKIDKMIDKVKDSEAIILDLRSNSGGYFFSLGKLIGNFFDKDTDICRVAERKETKRYYAEPRGKKNYAGKLVVLIGNDSASAAELFARVIQLEKRGTVIGDQSAGAVMQSKIYYHTFGLDSLVPYGVSVTVADILMKDGQRLEKIGVTPDEKLIPTALDFVNKRDPVLARAAQILGYKMTSEEAGKIFTKGK